MRVDEFEYPLPESAIAQEAIEPRHEARLLDTRDLSDHRFLDLPSLLEPDDLVVVNDTKVRAARLLGRRVDSGGSVELLVLDARPDGLWNALVRPARRIRPGIEIEFEGMTACIVEGPDQGLAVVELKAADVENAFETAGHIPLPPYFRGHLENPARYQTIFARTTGSAAAPTAGLHFTQEVVAALEARGVAMATVDLHVGIDTFRPITVSQVEDHRMHSEWYSVPEATAVAVSAARRRGARVVAVGTTVVRTLETAANEDGTVEPGSGETDLFLIPGSRMRVVDALVTNFHVPGSSLVVLLAAFMGDSWRRAYQVALDRGYRFLSFGDAMYAERSTSGT